MSKPNDGAPAFPIFTEQYDFGREHTIPKTVEPGMSLRDYFAAKAMEWVCAPNPVTGQRPMPSELDACAFGCYAMADAMLKARGA